MTINGLFFISAIGIAWLSYIVGYRGGLADGIKKAQRRARVIERLREQRDGDVW